MMASKQPPTLLPPTQAQQPDVVELDTGQQEVNAQSLKARLMSQVFFVVIFVSLLLALFVRLVLSLVSNVTKSRLLIKDIFFPVCDYAGNADFNKSY